ncbi:MAG: thiamine-phosphate kinase [Armatimonadota bacterium]|nr:thiamine-phosphate kinase [Armatimonadota bacterium]
MHISEFGGEPAVIDLIARICDGRNKGDLVLGIGDDAALIRISDGRLLIVTTDLLVEGTHFRGDLIDPYSLGWKSVAANISDIAAMAGRPTYTFSSFALDDVEVSFLESLYHGMVDCARAYGSEIVGGDTNASKSSQVINITQLGEVAESKAVFRSGARAGDRLLVTGTLGDSKAGLEALFKYGLENAHNLYPAVVEAHLRPRPRVVEAVAAAGTGTLHAMMDISDGLAADLAKLCAASKVGAVVSTGALPVSDALRQAAYDLGLSVSELALQGGEEYELLIAAAETDVEAITEAVVKATGTPATAIGRVTAEQDVLSENPDGSISALKGGWTHFT